MNKRGIGDEAESSLMICGVLSNRVIYQFVFSLFDLSCAPDLNQGIKIIQHNLRPNDSSYVT